MSGIMKRREVLEHLVAEQRRWIKAHGETQEGYVRRYGSVDDPKHYGDGGEAIWNADNKALEALLRRLDKESA